MAMPVVGMLIEKQKWIRKLDGPILKIYTAERIGAGAIDYSPDDFEPAGE
jgi:hypothetical protein